eukprot:299560_1
MWNLLICVWTIVSICIASHTTRLQHNDTARHHLTKALQYLIRNTKEMKTESLRKKPPILPNPKRLERLYFPNGNSPITFAERPSPFYADEMLATYWLYTIKQWLFPQLHAINDTSIAAFQYCMKIVLRSANDQHMQNHTAILERDHALAALHKEVGACEWYKANKELFDCFHTAFVQQMRQLNQLSAANLTFQFTLGHGTFGTVHLVQSTSTMKPYALKVFETNSVCMREQSALTKILLHGTPSRHIASIVPEFRHVINCDTTSAIVVDYVRGVQIDMVSYESVLAHPGGVFGFVHDCGQHLISALDVIQPLRIMHGDITYYNVLYDKLSKQFVLIDFGRAVDMDNISDAVIADGFTGSWQSFSEWGWWLTSAWDSRKDITRTRGDRKLSWMYGRKADRYGIRALQLEVLAWYAPTIMNQDLCTLSRAVIKDINDVFKNDRDWIFVGYPSLHRLWQKRSDVAEALQCMNNSIFHPMNMTAIAADVYYRIDDSMWFDGVAINDWESALRIVHSYVRQLCIYVEIGETVERLSLQNIFVYKYYHVPSFLMNRVEETGLNRLLEEGLSLQQIKSLQCMQIIATAIRFLKLFCDTYMSDELERQQRIQMLNAILDNGRELARWEPDFNVTNMFRLFADVIPPKYALYTELVNLIVFVRNNTFVIGANR